MKNIFRYLASFLVGAMTLAACQQEIAPLGTEISVNPATVSVAGQSAENETVTVKADGDWVAVAPEWITVAPAYGGAGETTVTLSFDDNLDADKSLAAARKATVLFSVAEKSAELVVEQAGDPNKAPAEVKVVTCAEFNAAEDNAGPFKVTGTITSIEEISPSTSYNNGNLTITDETGDLYLYRVDPGVDEKGEKKKIEDLGLAVGDQITVEGKKGSYKGAPQMAQGGVILEVVKSLISVNKVVPETLPIEGGELMVTLMCKGEGVEAVIPETAAWLSVVSAEHSGELAVVVLKAEANEGGNRSADVEFVTTFNGTEYKSVVTVSQLGAIKEVTVAEFIEASEGTALYQLTGKVSAITSAYNPTYGNVSFKLMDATGEVDIFRMTCPENATNLEVGDMITVCGTRSSYNDTPQMAQGETYISHIGNTKVTIEEFLAQSIAGDVWYELTGTIEEIVKEEYGNFYLNDGTSRVYVYGLTVAPVASNDKSFKSLGLKAGDIVTLVGTRAQYDKSSIEDQKEQVGGPAYYVSHEEGTPVEPEPDPTPDPEYTIDGKQWVGALDFIDGAVVFDFGVTEEEYLIIAAENEVGELDAYMVGLYELDEEACTITFTQYDIEWDEFMEPVVYTYANLTENSFDLTAEALGGTISLALAEEYLEISFGGGENEPAGAIENGEYWFIEPTSQKVMTVLGETQNYGHPASADAINGASTAQNAYTFTYNPDWSCYTIQDSYGRYVYSSMQDDGETPCRTLSVSQTVPADDDENLVFYMWTVYDNGDGTYDVYNAATYYSFTYSPSYNNWELYDPYADDFSNLFPALVKAENPVEEPKPEDPQPENPAGDVVTLTNAEIIPYMTESNFNYSEYTIESASGLWTVNASRSNENTFLQCRGKKGSFIKTPEFDKDIKSVTLYFTDKMQVYSGNIYCAFPSTWTVPTADAAYPEDGNVGRAVTDGSYSVTIPVAEGNKQVYVSLIRTNAYYVDHIDVAF